MARMLTVLETWQFAKEADKLFTEQERERLIDYLAWNPLAGDEIVGSGGLRKLRFATGSKGKSGGARVIYFFYSETAPLYLISCFAKNMQSNLTDAQVNAFAKLTAAIKAQHRKKRQ